MNTDPVIASLARRIVSREHDFGYPDRVFDIANLVLADTASLEQISEMLDQIESIQATWVFPAEEEVEV